MTTHTAGLPRRAVVWLLAAEALVLVPLWLNVPLWLLGVWLGCTAWRAWLCARGGATPGWVLKAMLMMGLLAGLYLSLGTVIGLEFAAALLVAASVLKLIEVTTPRDVRVVVMLGFFCLAVGYLFDASLAWALYSLLPLTALLTTLLVLELPERAGTPFAPARLAGRLLLQALPLLVVLFVLFPRMGPLWSLPMPGNKAQTGLSDNVAPGDIAELAQSAELAFRAAFDGPLPERQRLYWRALTLDRFDGTRWTQSDPGAVRQAATLRPQGPAYHYRVIQEASGQPWLFTLDASRLDSPIARQGYDFRWQRSRASKQAVSYEASAWPQAVREPELGDAARRQALALPAQGNPRSRELARSLTAAFTDPRQQAQALLRSFNQEPFHYTLKPSPLGANSIDGFLFDTRRGFCLHYAGAMTFILRAMGVPARIVIGYQGGEFNPRGNYLSVRQYDAHAWVEYWVPGVGWISADPTAAVAPQRVEAGLAEALAADEPFLAGSPFSALRYRQFAWLNEVRLGWENLNYGWERWVLGYQEAQQRQWLSRWFADYAGWALPITGGCTLAVLAVVLLRPRRVPQHPQLRLFRAFERALARKGVQRQTGEGPFTFAERASEALPEQAKSIQAFSGAFAEAYYGGELLAGDRARQALAQLKTELRWQHRRKP